MDERFTFRVPVKVRFNETDQQGHVNFIHFLAYFDVCLTDYLEAIGYGYGELLADGADLVYAESRCSYLSPVRWPEVLEVHGRIAHLGRRSVRFAFQVLAQADGRQVATGHIVAVIKGAAAAAEQRAMEKLRRAVEAFEGVPV